MPNHFSSKGFRVASFLTGAAPSLRNYSGDPTADAWSLTWSFEDGEVHQELPHKKLSQPQSRYLKVVSELQTKAFDI
jgi:hypothetical protein